MIKPRILLSAVSKKENYEEAVRACGGIPVMEYKPEEMLSYDGFILCGGNDINPAYYGEEIAGSVDIDYQRDEAEIVIAKEFIKAGKPIMGICRGYQLINILLGGSLYQHLETTDNHRSGNGEDAIHPVIAEKGSIVEKLYGAKFVTNSYHHQAIKQLGKHLRITARAEDGIVEAFEHESLPIFGVQWHPERMCCSHKREDTVDGSEIFRFFIESCKKIIFNDAGHIEHIAENLAPVFGDAWENADASGKDNMTIFSFSEDMTEAVIDNRKPYATLKKYMCQVEIIPGKTYRVDVPFQEFDTRGLNCVYGIVSLKSREGKLTRRMYMERTAPGQLSLVFRVEEETAVQLELGIKSSGKVIWYQPILREWEPLKPRTVRLASVYLEYKQLGFPYEENLKRIEESFDKAAAGGVDLVGYAEDINTSRTDNAQAFETLDGPFCTLMKQKAKEHSCYAFFSFHELDEQGCKRNTAVLLNRNGELVGKCSKSHLTIGEYEAGLVPGDDYLVFDTDFGKVGMLICWDAYFPEPARAMAFQGAELLLVSTAGNPHFRHVAIAKENGVHVLVSCRMGVIMPDEGVAPTKIISPCGEILAQCNTEGEAARVEIDLNNPKGIRWLSVGACDGFPHNVYMHEWRDDLYGKIK